MRVHYRLYAFSCTLISLWPCLCSFTSFSLHNTAVSLPASSNQTDDTEALRRVLTTNDATYYWTQYPPMPWKGRYGHTVVLLLDGSILLKGGFYNNYIEGLNYLNDVWRSTDGGRVWTVVTASAEWQGRLHHCSVVLPDGSVLVMGGLSSNSKNDVWRSTNGGVNWSLITSHAEWQCKGYCFSITLNVCSCIVTVLCVVYLGKTICSCVSNSSLFFLRVCIVSSSSWSHMCSAP
jgi:hypothetical protein